MAFSGHDEYRAANAALMALNSQLQEALERQRTTAVDLQNVLYSTDIATLFLDAGLRIRFFTPATQAVFNLLASDIGRPLADLRCLAADPALAGEALRVLHGEAPMECEIERPDGSWFTRRIVPYRSDAGEIAGVVITYNDVTERRRVKEALGAARRKAELASLAKTRFLAAANHDLRQPLQTLTLLHGLLGKIEQPERTRMLLGRLSEALGSMTTMLDTLLGINQIEAGTVKAEVVAFPIGEVIEALCRNFAVQAEAQGLVLRSVACSLMVHSDPRLLEQMLRNLVANAVKYTRRGKILIGCRRYGGTLRIQVLDTGVGIPADELQSIFDEYHQVAGATQVRGAGLGLGLSIVQRLGDLLDHPVSVRSIPSRGSMFTIDVPRAAYFPVAVPVLEIGADAGEPAEDARRSGAILMIEDDADLSDLLAAFLEGEGHRVTAAPSGDASLALIAQGAIRPDLLLTDFNLPGQINGLEVALRLREMFGHALPTIVLTGDISTATLQSVAQAGCIQFSKPVRLPLLTAAIQHALPPSCVRRPHAVACDPHDGDAEVVFVVDDDAAVLDAMMALLQHDGRRARAYASCQAFLDDYRPAPGQCLLIDGYLPDIDGIALLRRLRAAGQSIPAVMMTGNSDVAMAVAAMQAGASDFIEKPIGGAELLASVQRALDEAADAGKPRKSQADASLRLDMLTSRQREIMVMVLDGHPSKNIAADLHISQRTVENHRSAIMHKTGCTSLPALARLAVAASGST